MAVKGRPDWQENAWQKNRGREMRGRKMEGRTMLIPQCVQPAWPRFSARHFSALVLRSSTWPAGDRPATLALHEPWGKSGKRKAESENARIVPPSPAGYGGQASSSCPIAMLSLVAAWLGCLGLRRSCCALGRGLRLGGRPGRRPDLGRCFVRGTDFSGGGPAGRRPFFACAHLLLARAQGRHLLVVAGGIPAGGKNRCDSAGRGRSRFCLS